MSLTPEQEQVLKTWRDSRDASDLYRSVSSVTFPMTLTAWQMDAVSLLVRSTASEFARAIDIEAKRTSPR
jgi:hypothetical protein